MTRYRVIVSDPPWNYQSAHYNYDPNKHYQTMSIEQMCQLPIRSKAASDALLLLWCTWPHLKDGIKVAEWWGFEYVTGLPWVKLAKSEEDLWGDWHHKAQFGVGYWVRGASEPILICKRGKPPLPNGDFVGLLSPNIKHSRKPDSIYEYAESMPGPYLEMFARRQRDGWDQFGNEIANSIKL